MIMTKLKPARIDPTPAIECLVLDVKTGKAMTYDPITKLLSIEPKGCTVFTSKRAAHVAVFHNKERLKTEGVPEAWLLFSIEET